MDNLIKKMRHSKKVKTFQRKQDSYKFMKVEDYNNKFVSLKLIKIILSFIGFVNENNYKK